MKRSEMLKHIAADIEETLVNLENRPNTRPHAAKKLANNILDMLEGFGMLPPGELNKAGNIIYKWEPEDE